VSGRGLALLRRAGVRVETGLLAREAEALSARFLTAARRRRPYVLLKSALTLDGRIATATGRSKWITSPAQRRQARWLRRLHDAVLVGIGTALADDPGLRLPPRGRLARSASARAPVLVLCRSGAPARKRRALEARGVSVVEVRARGGRVAPAAALAALGKRGITSVMVEGGSEVAGSFLAARLVDEVALFRAPLLLGGRGSVPAFGGPDPGEIGEALRLEPLPDADAFPWPWPPLFERWRPAESGRSPRRR
jgi:diaminohydroxyphosphoribosylaminopyrimidine deaminase/5-amino-6-(5-phosphoribosylamino)uracil reductase